MKRNTTQQASPALALDLVAAIKTKVILLAMALGILAAGFARGAEERKTSVTPRQQEPSEMQRRAALAYNGAGWYADGVLSKAAEYRAGLAAMGLGDPDAPPGRSIALPDGPVTKPAMRPEFSWLHTNTF